MRLRDFLNADIAYTRAENEIREWVETRYPGLSIDFYPHLEIVRTSKRNFSEKRGRKITEVVNIKIGEILEKHADEIYVGERLERIWQKHPDFDLDVKSIDEIKRNPLFLKYLDELIIR